MQVKLVMIAILFPEMVAHYVQLIIYISVMVFPVYANLNVEMEFSKQERIVMMGIK